MSSKESVVVIGCGVIGLTTAIRILESKPDTTVHIVADHLPLDPLKPEYASSIAGAHHLSFAADEDLRQRHFDARTFEVFWDELEEEMRDGSEPSGLMKLTQTEYYDGNEKHLELLSGLPDFRVLPKDELPSFATHSVSFTSLTVTPAAYLRRLLAQFRKLGGQLHRTHLNSIQDALALTSGTTPSAVIVCAGLGALKLGGVEDKNVYPTRGQVLLLRAPWCRSGWTYQIGSLNGGEGGTRTYIIPRYNGQVIIGGTRELNDWHGEPRLETSLDILSRALKICPKLAPPSVRLSGREGTVNDLLPLVEADVVGFRPSRTVANARADSGLRLEKGPALVHEGGETQVIYNYGHGGFGWQSCWGCAEEVVALLEGSQARQVGLNFRHAAGCQS